jgi:ankyrin repeat protein
MRGTSLLICITLVSCAPNASAPAGRQSTGQPAAATQPAKHDLPQDADGLTELHRGAERGDAAAVAKLLNAGADPNVRGRDGVTPLMSTLVGAYSDMNRRSMPPTGQADNWSLQKSRERERQTRGQPDPAKGPMQFAEVVRLLLAHGADAKEAIRNGSTPLHAAAYTGDPELVSLLLSAGADPNAVQHPQGTADTTPLSIAAGRGDVDAVRVLLDAGADPAKVPEQSQGYLFSQAMSDVNVFRLLVDRGLKVPPDALQRATRNNRIEVAREIMRRQNAGDFDAALYAAVRAWGSDSFKPEQEERLVQTVTMLLDAGASASAPNHSGEALVRAILRGPPSVARLLQERGAKVDWSRLTDKEHNPSKIAYGAVLENRIDRLKQLESLGMPLDVWSAAVLGRAERLRELLKGKNLGATSDRGSTALYFAAGYGHEEAVRVLLDAGADPNERMPSWDTPDIGPRPLDGAAEAGHVAIVRLLLGRGAKTELMTLDADERAKLRPEVRELLPVPSTQP